MTFFAFTALSVSARALHSHVNFHDLVSNSDVVVLATCTGITADAGHAHPGTVFSHAVFSDVEIVRIVSDRAHAVNGTLELDYLGGVTPSLSTGVSDMPKFRVGERYLLFLLHDGVRYVSPVIGGLQGQFAVATDARRGAEYLLNANGRRLIGIEGDELVFANSGTNSAKDPGPAVPMPLADVIRAVQSHSFTAPSMEEHLNNTKPMPVLWHESPETVNHQGSVKSSLGACQSQEVYIWFEEVPSGWWSHAIDDNAKAVWDTHMNIYSDTPNPTNGFGTNNGSPEILGWPLNSDLINTYGFSWPPTALALTHSNWSGGDCGEITDADICFNPYFTWAETWDIAVNMGAVDYRRTIMHELGHSWGYLAGPDYTETYDYDQPSVMHGYDWGATWEDGKEIHSKDAQIYRDLYDNQTAVRDVDDMGVESYWASNGVHTSTPSSTYVQTGSQVTINNVTIENNSDDAQHYVHLRFYLSTNRTLGSADHLVKDAALGTRLAESRLVQDYVLDLDGVPAGVYYVGMKVTINGYDGDDRPANDITWSTFQIQVWGGVGVQESPEVLELEVYPNPASDQLTIRMPMGNKALRLELVDMQGRLVPMEAMLRAAPAEVALDLSSLAAGFYSVRLITEEGAQYCAHVIKN